MNVHKNAGLTPRGRQILINRLLRGEPPVDVATASGISVRTVYKWRRRYRAEGPAGLRDRTSGPRHGPERTPAEPPVDHPLLRAWRDDAPWLRDRLVITPHTAFYSEQVLYVMRYKAADALIFEKSNSATTSSDHEGIPPWIKSP